MTSVTRRRGSLRYDVGANAGSVPFFLAHGPQHGPVATRVSHYHLRERHSIRATQGNGRQPAPALLTRRHSFTLRNYSVREGLLKLQELETVFVHAVDYTASGIMAHNASPRTRRHASPMSMKWKLRKDKIQAETPDADPQAPADTAPPAMPASPIFDLSGAAFAPVSKEPLPVPPRNGEGEGQSYTPPASGGAGGGFVSVEDEPAADGEGLPHTDAVPVADPRFEVDEDALSFLTEDAPIALPPADEIDAEVAHADAGPQGVVLPSDIVPPAEGVAEFARLDAHDTSDTPAFAEPAFEAAPSFDAEAPTFETDAPAFDNEPAPAFSLDAPLSDTQRDAVAPGLVSADDGGLPRVAPFVIDLPAAIATPIGSADASRHLILRLGNLSATYELNKPVTTIGRPDSITQNYPDIEIELDDGVSRRHAEVRRDGPRFWVVDVGSTNGTILNGEMLAPQQPILLAHGDRIRVGERTEIVFE